MQISRFDERIVVEGLDRVFRQDRVDGHEFAVELLAVFRLQPIEFDIVEGLPDPVRSLPQGDGTVLTKPMDFLGTPLPIVAPSPRGHGLGRLPSRLHGRQLDVPGQQRLVVLDAAAMRHPGQ